MYSQVGIRSLGKHAALYVDSLRVFGPHPHAPCGDRRRIVSFGGVWITIDGHPASDLSDVKASLSAAETFALSAAARGVGPACYVMASMTWVEKVRASRWATLGVIVIPVLLLGAGLVWLLTDATKSPAPKLPPADEERPRKNRTKRRPATAAKPRAFISFAAEDAQVRDLFVGQGKHPDTPWKIADHSLHEPFANAWKTKTKTRIKGCDVVIVLIGKDTHQAQGALWEIETAKELGLPVFGVHISKDDKGKLPGCMFGMPVIHWTWDGIAKQIKKATRKSRRR